MLCKPVEAFQLNHKSFCNHFWYHIDDPRETWLSGNYSTAMYNKRVDRDTAYLTEIVVLKSVITLRANSLIKHLVKMLVLLRDVDSGSLYKAEP